MKIVAAIVVVMVAIVWIIPSEKSVTLEYHLVANEMDGSSLLEVEIDNPDGEGRVHEWICEDQEYCSGTWTHTYTYSESGYARFDVLSAGDDDITICLTIKLNGMNVGIRCGLAVSDPPPNWGNIILEVWINEELVDSTS